MLIVILMAVNAIVHLEIVMMAGIMAVKSILILIHTIAAGVIIYAVSIHPAAMDSVHVSHYIMTVILTIQMDVNAAPAVEYLDVLKSGMVMSVRDVVIHVI